MGKGLRGGKMGKREKLGEDGVKKGEGIEGRRNGKTGEIREKMRLKMGKGAVGKELRGREMGNRRKTGEIGRNPGKNEV